MKKLILFDCDSTLSQIEGVDEMARLRGEAVYREIEEMTRLAMEGTISLNAIFGRRLELVRPSRQETESIGRAYIETVEPHARAVVRELARRGWEIGIISGGYRQAIRPLADFLGIELIEAVDLHFQADGSYESYDSAYPTTRNGGKKEIVERLRETGGYERVVMVGDGVSDLETKEAVDLFIGYGGYATREAVKKEADHFVLSLAEVPSLVDFLRRPSD
jgi:phosphoserine phosphatase